MSNYCYQTRTITKGCLCSYCCQEEAVATTTPSSAAVGNGATNKSSSSKQAVANRRTKQASKNTTVVETQDAPERVKTNKILGSSIQFVHYSGDTHFEPSKLADVKLYPIVESKGHEHQETVVRLDLLDIRSDDVYEKLSALGHRLHSLAIRDLSLNYIPKDLQPIWSNITSLDFSGNALNEFAISDALPHLTNLSELNLNNNNLQQLPKAFKGLRQLKRLFLSNNRLISLSNLDVAQLQWFVADGNNLQSLDSFLTSSNSDRSLQVLDVSHNELTSLPGLIKNFKSLVDLDISCNNIRVLPIELFKLPSLQFLNASCNRISHVPSFSTQTATFSRSQLRTVDLSDNVLSKLPEHLLFLADRVDVANNSIKFIRGNLLQKITFSSKKQLRIEGNPLLFPPAALVANDGLRGLLSFFGAIKNKVKRRQGIKVFIIGATHNGKTSFIKSLVDEFPHIAEEPTVLANYDEIFVDIDAPGELGNLLPNSSTSGDGVFPSVPPTPGFDSVANSAFDPCCPPGNKNKDQRSAKKPLDVGNDYTIGLPREIASVRKRNPKKRLSISTSESEFAGGTNKAALWKCVQMPVLDMTGRGIFATLRKYFLEDACLYIVVFNLSTYPSTLPSSSPTVAQWYRDNVGAYLDEIFVLCKEAYVILVGSFVDKVDTTTEINERCHSVLALANNHCQQRKDALISQMIYIEKKPQMTMSDQERLMLLKSLLEKQKIRLCDRVVTFSSQIEGHYSSATLSTLIELLQSGAAQGEAQDLFFKPALEPITNLHSDIIEYIELLASSMRFPIVDNRTFEDIFFKEYQIISEQIVKRIPKFLHLTGHIFWSLKNDVLSELVCLRPEFITEFLVALFSYVFDEKPLLTAMTSMQDSGRRLYQLGANEVRDSALRFVRTGILITHVGELLVRKALNIKSSESLQATVVASLSQRNSSSSGEAGGDAESGSAPSSQHNEDGIKTSEPISSAPIHVCVEKFCVGFQLAYFFDTDSLEYTTMFHPKIADIDMKSVPSRATSSDQPGPTTSSIPIKLDNRSDPANAQNKDRKIVSFATGKKASGKEALLSHENSDSSINTTASSSERTTSPVRRAVQISPTAKRMSISSAVSGDGDGDDEQFFLRFPKNAKVVRQAILSAGGNTGSPTNERNMSAGSRSSRTPSIVPSGTNSSNGPNNTAPGQRFLLFPALRPPILPPPYKLAIADAWDSLSPDMWIGASLTFPPNFYPPSAFHEIITRVRRKVSYLEFGYVWQKGAFGKFVNSTNCFAKFLHHHCTPMDCDLNSLLGETDAKPQGEEADVQTDGPVENTITFELRTNTDTPSPESAKLALVAGFMFSEKTLRDYVMNLWERLYEILAVVEEYCGSFAALLVDRRVRCPFCCKLAFIGEWTSPRELQAFHEKSCPTCGTSVDTAYLVQPKSSQRELCERIMKDIQKRRAGTLLASDAAVVGLPDSDDSSDDSWDIRNDDDGIIGAGDDAESVPPSSRRQTRPVRRRANALIHSTANSAVSTTSSRSSKRSARLFVDRDELMTMMTSDS